MSNRYHVTIEVEAESIKGADGVAQAVADAAESMVVGIEQVNNSYDLTPEQHEVARETGSQLLAAVADVVGEHIEDNDRAYAAVMEADDGMHDIIWRAIYAYQEALGL